jgi:hypothetical protein
MSAIWKGTVGPVVVSEEIYHDAETGNVSVDIVYQGSRDAIFGLSVEFENQRVSFQTSQSGPVHTLTARIPTIINTGEVPSDRYEISTESMDKSIFEHPTIVEDANEYDSGIAAESKPYKKLAEESLEKQPTYSLAGGFSDPANQNFRFASVVRHLRNGVTGFQIDFIVLRRFRKVALDYGYGSAGRISLDSGLHIYSTAQLNLPQSVAFSLPATPTAPSTDYGWGWRKRGQRVDIVGNYAEQTVELVFAPWSTMLYSDATGNLDW